MQMKPVETLSDTCFPAFGDLSISIYMKNCTM